VRVSSSYLRLVSRISFPFFTSSAICRFSSRRFECNIAAQPLNYINFQLAAIEGLVEVEDINLNSHFLPRKVGFRRCRSSRDTSCPRYRLWSHRRRRGECLRLIHADIGGGETESRPPPRPRHHGTFQAGRSTGHSLYLLHIALARALRMAVLETTSPLILTGGKAST